MTPASQSARPVAGERRGLLAFVGGGVLNILQIIGAAALLFLATLRRIRFDRRTWARIIAQTVRIGTDTLPLAFLVSLFVGMVLVLQAAEQLERYTQAILGSLVGLAMTKELGPVIMAFLIAGRAGSAIAAEIGSMNAYEEINALKTMDIDPIQFLVVPRFLAMTMALPMLILYADVIGIAGGALVVAFDATVKIGVQQYLDNLTQWINATDVVVGVTKGFVFGMVISTVCCTFGFRTHGSAAGVATATTAAVVWSFVLIIICDFFIVRLAIIL